MEFSRRWLLLRIVAINGYLELPQPCGGCVHAEGRLLVGEMGRQKVRICAWVAAPSHWECTLAAATKAKGGPSVTG